MGRLSSRKRAIKPLWTLPAHSAGGTDGGRWSPSRAIPVSRNGCRIMTAKPSSRFLKTSSDRYQVAWPPPIGLFDGHRFREIAWLVDVGAHDDAGIIGQ